jgi:hypothetical protein
MNEVYTDLEELAKRFEATDKLVLIQTIGELEQQIKELMKDCSSYATNIDLLIGDLEGAQDKIKELTEYAHHHQSCDSVGVYGKLDIECNCGFKQVMK